MCSPLFISLEGNIGSGKSTTLSHLSDFYHKIPEPVHLYNSFASHEPLNLLYSAPECNAATTQLHIQRCCSMWYKTELEKSISPIVVSERSLCASPKVFIDCQRSVGTFSEFVSDFLKQENDDLVSKQTDYLPEYFIYLSCPPELAYLRVKQRSRDCEYAITLQYLTQLYKAHEKAFRGRENTFVIDVKADSTTDEITSQVDSIIVSLWRDFKNEKM